MRKIECANVAGFDCGIELTIMYAQSPTFCSYPPSGFSVHSQVETWKMDAASNVQSVITEDQYFVRQFERNILATKTRPTNHMKTVKVRLCKVYYLSLY